MPEIRFRELNICVKYNFFNITWEGRPIHPTKEASPVLAPCIEVDPRLTQPALASRCELVRFADGVKTSHLEFGSPDIVSVSSIPCFDWFHINSENLRSTSFISRFQNVFSDFIHLMHLNYGVLVLPVFEAVIFRCVRIVQFIDFISSP